MRIRKDFHHLTFKTEAEVIVECKKLILESKELDLPLKEIKKLKRGKVKPYETNRRSRIGSYFTEEVQQIFNYITHHKLKLSDEIRKKLDKIIHKSDMILRENIVLQSKPPLDVIKFKDVFVRYTHSSETDAIGRKEQRWGYGLHKSPLRDKGCSITIAIMPSNYTQSYHNHTISEYCLVLDGKTNGLIIDKNKKEKLIANSNEILHFFATTPHTLSNPDNVKSRNMTVKLPTALKDWRPLHNLNPVKNTKGEVLKGKIIKVDVSGKERIIHKIHDKSYNYQLEIIKLKKGYVLEKTYSTDKYFFVIEGNLEISTKGVKKQCSKNDYIVIDKKTPIKIITKSKARLYTVTINLSKKNR
ncbi:hypothetical protein GOV04_00180 [Candidatus Woesearchaeota archaeon]|nr:hypothetical protein [Candidatus Woesearchaeota archaeon]